MSRTIKLIWDFKGDAAEKTAEHHKVHLEEFGLKEQLPAFNYGVDEISTLHWIAYITVKEKNVIIVRDALKPHRAEIVE